MIFLVSVRALLPFGILFCFPFGVARLLTVVFRSLLARAPSKTSGVVVRLPLFEETRRERLFSFHVSLLFAKLVLVFIVYFVEIFIVGESPHGERRVE